MRTAKRGRWVGFAALLVALALLGVTGGRAQDEDVVLGTADLSVVGLDLTVAPPSQAVPRGVQTTVTTSLGGTDVTIPLSALTPFLPQPLTVQGELHGPAFLTPLTLSAPAGSPITIPTLPIKGRYTLENIRLVGGAGISNGQLPMANGEVLIAASPTTVVIEAMGDVLITSVQTRPLSLQEIRDRGIVLDSSNFTVINFTAVVGIQSTRVPIEFPIILPRVTPGMLPQAPPPATVEVPELQLASLQVSAIQFVPVLPQIAQEEQLPPIDALLIFPGSIGFLHQFFQALLIVTNGAPAGTPLVLKDLQATIQLPSGDDQIPATELEPGDDPLRLARLQSGAQRTLPVKGLGPDGVLGTADDTDRLLPGETGNADFTVEGLKEGTHQIKFEITTTLEGLARGPAQLLGKAKGAILVRNPTFTLILGHPNVVREGARSSLGWAFRQLTKAAGTYRPKPPAGRRAAAPRDRARVRPSLSRWRREATGAALRARRGIGPSCPPPSASVRTRVLQGPWSRAMAAFASLSVFSLDMRRGPT